MKAQTKNAPRPSDVWLNVARGVGIGIGIGGVLATTAVAGAASYLVTQLIKPTPPNPMEAYSASPFEFDVDYEEVTFPTVDGTSLSGWLFVRPNDPRIVVMANGYRGRREDMLGASSYLWRRGYNVLLFDYRGYGIQRTPSMVTLGHSERQDYEAALRYVKERFAQPLIGAFGGSMGAAIVLSVAAADPDIRAVWADSSFADQRDVIAHNWRQITHLPNSPVMEIADAMFARRTGHRFSDLSPVNNIAKIAPRPVYIVHSTHDSTIPPHDAQRLYEAAAEPKELWITEGHEHCGVYFAQRHEYTRRMHLFFDRWLIADALPTRAASELHSTAA